MSIYYNQYLAKSKASVPQVSIFHECCKTASLQRLLRVNIKINNQVETLVGLLHNPHAFTSPVDEVVAWGEDTWP